MAEVLRTQPQVGMALARDRDPSVPTPLPAFVFPFQPEKSETMPVHEKSASNLDITGPRHTRNRSRPQHLSINALPAFDFSPATSQPVNRSPSPPRSPSRRTPPPHHLSGHRRNGSEFVGGAITNGGPILVSSSPTKSECSIGHRRDGSGLATATIEADSVRPPISEGMSTLQSDLRLGPPTTRRGHAHRRSGAISSHDVSMIVRPSSDARGGSAPTTPLDAMFQPTFPPVLDRSTSQPSLLSSTQEPAGTARCVELPNENGQLRSRVRISDVLEFIPRPLSTISSETSSSMSTIRASHSVNNSITSLFSGGASSPPPASTPESRRGLSTSQIQPRPRPDIMTNSPSPSPVARDLRVTSSETTTNRPSTAPVGDSPPKAISGNMGTSVQTIFPTMYQASNKLFSRSDTSLARPEMNYDAVLKDITGNRPRQSLTPASPSPLTRPRTSPEPKITKRQRKGRSWHDLLLRKGKVEAQRTVASRFSPSPPMQKSSPEPEFSLDDVNFDDDTDCIIETASPYARKEFNDSVWKPLPSSPVSDTDGSISMLDIDAALASMDTPGSGTSFEDAVGNNGIGPKRRMHSSGITGGFAGPGMHYHRRAESAPELEPIDRSRFGFPRLGSNPAMAIEEEAEEADEEAIEGFHPPPARASPSSQQIQEDPRIPGLGVDIIEAATTSEDKPQRRRRRASDEGLRTQMPSKLRLTDDFSNVEIVGSEEEPRFSVVTKSSDESTITPTLPHHSTDSQLNSVPHDFAMPTPALTYGTPETPSAVSSPDFSKTSFEVPRSHTAHSSITDRATLSSSRTCDHGLGVHSSVDDVPSLTSSASTMSARPPRISSSANSGFSTDRSFSLSAPVPARTRPVSAHKRLSLASLSRLAGGSYNRSKLNIEESAVPENTEQIQKKKKGNRISRMMKFWKLKEKVNTSC